MFIFSVIKRSDQDLVNKTKTNGFRGLCLTYLLAELSEGGVSKERDVSEELVTDVRFGSVHGGAVVPDVLGGVEHSEGQPRQEVPGGE